MDRRSSTSPSKPSPPTTSRGRIHWSRFHLAANWRQLTKFSITPALTTTLVSSTSQLYSLAFNSKHSATWTLRPSRSSSLQTPCRAKSSTPSSKRPLSNSCITIRGTIFQNRGKVIMTKEACRLATRTQKETSNKMGSPVNLVKTGKTNAETNRLRPGLQNISLGFLTEILKVKKKELRPAWKKIQAASKLGFRKIMEVRMLCSNFTSMIKVLTTLGSAPVSRS